MSSQAELAAPSAPPGALPASASVPNRSALPSPRHPAWADVPESRWNDVGWQLKNAIRNAADLARLLDLSEAERRATDTLGRVFSFAVTPYYFSLIDPADPDDPIRRMILPSLEEERSTAFGEVDPLGEKPDQVAPGLTHRYPDRVLFVVTSFCTSYCRFCIRKRNWHDSDAARSRDDVDQALAYIRAHPEIRDVLISGGDPLTLPPKQLDYALAGTARDSARRDRALRLARAGAAPDARHPRAGRVCSSGTRRSGSTPTSITRARSRPTRRARSTACCARGSR